MSSLRVYSRDSIMTGRTSRQLKTACVFCSGDPKDPERVREVAARCDLLIAADGGEKLLAGVGLKPDVVIGDMDSAAAEAKDISPDAQRIVWPANKDKSDAELAVEYALEQGCDQVILLGAVGGRLDHTLGNVALAAKYPGRVALLDGGSTLVAVDRSEECVLHGQTGTVVSLIPFGCGAAKVWTTGLKYPLQHEELRLDTHGVSNELCEPEARVRVLDGVVLVYIESGETWLNS